MDCTLYKLKKITKTNKQPLFTQRIKNEDNERKKERHGMNVRISYIENLVKREDDVLI